MNNYIMRRKERLREQRQARDTERKVPGSASVPRADRDATAAMAQRRIQGWFQPNK